MNRYLASGLGLTLALVASAGRADDIVWRAPRDRSPQPPAALPAQPPAGGMLAGANGADISWIRARGQVEEPSPVPRDVEGLSAPKGAVPNLPPSMPNSVSSQVISDTQPGCLPGQQTSFVQSPANGRAPRFEVS